MYKNVIELYKECFYNYVNRIPVDVDKITDIQKQLNYAIDVAIIEDHPIGELEALTNDVAYLKYNILPNE